MAGGHTAKLPRRETPWARQDYKACYRYYVVQLIVRLGAKGLKGVLRMQHKKRFLVSSAASIDTLPWRR